MVWRSDDSGRVARSIGRFFDQADAAWPNRSTTADGTIASARHHQQNPDSDHELNEHDVVQAGDLTDDPAHGADMDKLAERIRHDRDPRVKYVIDNKRMFSSYAAHGVPAWTWRTYTGADPHTGHLHLSVVDDPKLYDDPRPWACFEEDDVALSDADKEWLRKAVRAEVRGALNDDDMVVVPGEAGEPEGTRRSFATAVRVLWALGLVATGRAKKRT